jgi:hypothetical protein
VTSAVTINKSVVTVLVDAQLTDGAELSDWTSGTAEVRLVKGVVKTPDAELDNAVTTQVLTVN